MKKEEFLGLIVNELELEDKVINVLSPLNLTSLRQLSLISFLDEHFGIRVRAKDLLGIDNVDKLLNLIGREKFDM